MKSFIKKANEKLTMAVIATRTTLADKRGESSVGTAITILISVVIGALLLAGLYTLFSSTILPTLTDKVRQMFDYQG